MACLRAVAGSRPRLRAAECSPRARRSTGSSAAAFGPAAAVLRARARAALCARRGALRPARRDRKRTPGAALPIRCSPCEPYARWAMPGAPAEAPKAPSIRSRAPMGVHLRGSPRRPGPAAPPAAARSRVRIMSRAFERVAAPRRVQRAAGAIVAHVRARPNRSSLPGRAVSPTAKIPAQVPPPLRGANVFAAGRRLRSRCAVAGHRPGGSVHLRGADQRGGRDPERAGQPERQ